MSRADRLQRREERLAVRHSCCGQNFHPAPPRECCNPRAIQQSISQSVQPNGFSNSRHGSTYPQASSVTFQDNPSTYSRLPSVSRTEHNEDGSNTFTYDLSGKATSRDVMDFKIGEQNERHVFLKQPNGAGLVKYEPGNGVQVNTVDLQNGRTRLIITVPAGVTAEFKVGGRKVVLSGQPEQKTSGQKVPSNQTDTSVASLGTSTPPISGGTDSSSAATPPAGQAGDVSAPVASKPTDTESEQKIKAAMTGIRYALSGKNNNDIFFGFLESLSPTELRKAGEQYDSEDGHKKGDFEQLIKTETNDADRADALNKKLDLNYQPNPRTVPEELTEIAKQLAESTVTTTPGERNPQPPDKKKAEKLLKDAITDGYMSELKNELNTNHPEVDLYDHLDKAGYEPYTAIKMLETPRVALGLIAIHSEYAAFDFLSWDKKRNLEELATAYGSEFPEICQVHDRVFKNEKKLRAKFQSILGDERANTLLKRIDVPSEIIDVPSEISEYIKSLFKKDNASVE